MDIFKTKTDGKDEALGAQVTTKTEKEKKSSSYQLFKSVDRKKVGNVDTISATCNCAYCYNKMLL